MIVPQIFQFVDCVPFEFVNGTGVGIEDTHARMPEDLRYEDRGYTCMG
jgi:hypothetical protein